MVKESSDPIEKLRIDIRAYRDMCADLAQSMSDLEVATRKGIQATANIQASQLTIIKRMFAEFKELMDDFQNSKEEVSKEIETKVSDNEGWQQ